jgi:hypothetical protein
MPTSTCIGQIHRDLGVLDPPRGTGVLTLHTDRVRVLLQIASLIYHQHAVGLTEPSDEIPAQIVTHTIGVPFRLTQQVLQAIRRAMAGVLGQRN